VNNGDGSYSSAPYTPAAGAGTYQWVANYSGDANNYALTGACGNQSEQVTVAQSAPTLTTQPSAGIVIGNGTITDTATLTGGTSPTGTITFTIYGPGDSTCKTPLVPPAKVTVSGDGSYSPPTAFTPTAAGSYQWIAAYSGDSNNSATSDTCGTTSETVTAAKTSPSLTTQATAKDKTVTDTATLTGAYHPTGTITFALYGPNDSTCATTPVATMAVNVTGAGTATASANVTTPGTYRWVASYAGDTNNNPTSDPCNSANETVTVTP
jgi:hypothetical protein